MKESSESKRRRILSVLLQGVKLTPKEANDIADTTEGTRHIRYLREKYPIKDERVDGESYHVYWLDEEFLYEWWKSNNNQEYVTSV